MRKTHIIIDSIVANTIVATVAEAQAAFPDALCLDAEQHPGGIGWHWDGTALHAPEQPAPEPAPTPEEVPRYCGVIALKRHQLVEGDLLEISPEASSEGSLYAEVLAFYEAMPESLDKDKLEAALFNVMHWLRTSPSVENMRVLLGLTAAQVDALFVWAKAYEASI